MHSFSPTPDPVLTANIYASGLIEDVLQRVIVPFRSALRRQWAADECYLWLMRYSRGGEHLKIRIHSAIDNRERVKALLTVHAEEFLAEVRLLPVSAPRTVSKPTVAAIDLEDSAPEMAPDRSILWTTYKRTAVSFPGSPWLEDDEFIKRSCLVLGNGCELLLDALKDKTLESVGARQGFLGRAILSALWSLNLHEPSVAVEYFKYHRDWLLRFFLMATPTEERALKQFAEQVQRVPETIRWMARAALAPDASDVPAARRSWWDTLANLVRYAEQFRNSDEHQIDPFARDNVFPVIFKVLHGLANQIGLRPMQEAYVHHLALTAVETLLPHKANATPEDRELVRE